MSIEDPLAEVPVGTTLVVRATFADTEGGTGVSTAVSFKFRLGIDGDVTTLSSPNGAIANPSENVWTCRFTVSAAGRWFVDAVSTAGLGAVASGHVIGVQSAFD